MRKIIRPINSVIKNLRHKTNKIKKEKEQELKEIQQLDKSVTKEKKKSYIDEATKKYDLSYILTFWLIWIFVLYIAYVLFNSLELLYLIIAAYIISIAMEVVIDFFQKFIPRIASIIFSYVLLLLLLISWFVVIIPFVLAQSADIMQSFIDIVAWIEKDIRTYWLEEVIKNSTILPWLIQAVILEQLENVDIISEVQDYLQQNLNDLISEWGEFVRDVGSIAASVVAWFFSAIFQILLVFVLAIFFSAQKDSVMNFIGSVSWKKDYVIVKLQKLYKKLWFWLKWQFLLSIFIFITVLILLNTVALFWIDLPNKFTLALIAWITEFIPIIWPILWAIPALLVAISEYWFVWFLIIAMIYILIQWFENYILVPLVMNQALWVSPLLIIIAMLIWGSLMWFVWIVLSVPIAVIANLIFEDIVKD